MSWSQVFSIKAGIFLAAACVIKGDLFISLGLAVVCCIAAFVINDKKLVVPHD